MLRFSYISWVSIIHVLAKRCLVKILNMSHYIYCSVNCFMYMYQSCIISKNYNIMFIFEFFSSQLYMYIEPFIHTRIYTVYISYAYYTHIKWTHSMLNVVHVLLQELKFWYTNYCILIRKIFDTCYICSLLLNSVSLFLYTVTRIFWDVISFHRNKCSVSL